MRTSSPNGFEDKMMHNSVTPEATEDDFKFDVAAPENWIFAPGDNIIGNLVRGASIITPEATVKIDLVGRMETSIRTGGKAHSNHKKTYAEHILLFESQETLIHNGPLHLPHDSDEKLNFEFSIKIPERPKKHPYHVYTKVTSHLPVDNPDHPDHKKLPPPFASGNLSMFGNVESAQAEVKYFLVATLRYKSAGHVKIHAITWPFKIRYSSTKTIEEYQIRQVQSEAKVQSQRLLPGMKDATLSLHQKTRNLLRSSKVPEFYFNMTVSSPMSIRFSDPEPLRISVQFDPLPEKTSDDIKDIVREIRVDSIKIFLRATTDIRFTSNPEHTRRHCDTHTKTSNLGLDKMLSLLESPLVVSTGKGNKPLNLGDMFQLTMNEFGMLSGNKRLYPTPRLYPDFTTHSIRHTHGLDFKVNVKIDGESVTVETSLPVKLLSVD
ncbi:hypothetical protein N7478_012613 [Penicillium angulare]|uniref:uncharacterized protein n=1 Tax=Penicillium angulare TaxID=116970 RepID=UPI00254266F6|nr:uncharacterized protein N7478_012613 [Penicillium angulare]KAJ5259632.1 hypothetical protein N7478_012613 [Penicillium angulare]